MISECEGPAQPHGTQATRLSRQQQGGYKSARRRHGEWAVPGYDDERHRRTEKVMLPPQETRHGVSMQSRIHAMGPAAIRCR